MRLPLRSVFVRRRHLLLAGVALLALSPFGLPDLPPLPEMLGLMPEPAVVTPPPQLTAAETGWATPAPARPAGSTARSATSGAPPAIAPPPQEQPSGGALPTLPADATPRGRYHRVEPGETAATIASAYGLPSQWAVYDANPGIVRPNRLTVGSWLYIPHPATPPAPRPRPGQPGYTGQASARVIVDGIWLQLAACESSGNWAIDSGNGYYGGLQFTLDSWRMVGGAGYPHEAHPMEQIARADYLQRIQGWEAWPLCAEKLGLLPPGEGQAVVERARAAQRAERAQPSPTRSP